MLNAHCCSLLRALLIACGACQVDVMILKFEVREYGLSAARIHVGQGKTRGCHLVRQSRVGEVDGRIFTSRS
jgi:hypothetical protein